MFLFGVTNIARLSNPAKIGSANSNSFGTPLGTPVASIYVGELVLGS